MKPKKPPLVVIKKKRNANPSVEKPALRHVEYIKPMAKPKKPKESYAESWKY